MKTVRRDVLKYAISQRLSALVGDERLRDPEWLLACLKEERGRLEEAMPKAHAFCREVLERGQSFESLKEGQKLLAQSADALRDVAMYEALLNDASSHPTVSRWRAAKADLPENVIPLFPEAR